MKYFVKSGFSAGLLFGSVAYAQSSCSATLSPNYPAPSVAEGYVARLVANGLTDPRGIKFDSNGALLVVESGVGITALSFAESDDGCVDLGSKKTVISDTTLNHGIEISRDGATLYASNPEAAYSWDYSAKTQKNTSAPTTLVTKMSTTDHTTRTLLLSRFAPGLMVITRGSTANIDPLANDISSGHSQIKAFNLTNMTGAYDFDNDGALLGWGLRNDVGIDEEPTMGGIYSVENSVDQMTRNGQDIHNTNPSEELNFFGYLNSKPSSNQGRNFGYPECYTAWDVDTIPDFNGKAGEQFAIGQLSKTNNDSMCSESERQAARLGFHPHMAPLDILFDDKGTAAWVTFHGSWDSDVPVGYKLSMIKFANGEPVEPSTSKTAAIDIVSNHDISQCYEPNKCFRPVGLAWDSKGRLFMSSDETGEIYAISRADGKSVNTGGSGTTGASSGTTGTGSGSSPTAKGMASATSSMSMSALAIVFGILAYLV